MIASISTRAMATGYALLYKCARKAMSSLDAKMCMPEFTLSQLLVDELMHSAANRTVLRLGPDVIEYNHLWIACYADRYPNAAMLRLRQHISQHYRAHINSRRVDELSGESTWVQRGFVVHGDVVSDLDRPVPATTQRKRKLPTDSKSAEVSAAKHSKTSESVAAAASTESDDESDIHESSKGNDDNDVDDADATEDDNVAPPTLESDFDRALAAAKDV